jgi:hypothetical protein
MRPSKILALLLIGLALTILALDLRADRLQAELQTARAVMDIAAAGLGLTDLCVATEARYTRHPAVSDHLAPFMNYPGAMEHFPTGSFWTPPPHLR